MINSCQSRLCAFTGFIYFLNWNPVLRFSSLVSLVWEHETHVFGILEGHGVICCDYFQNELFTVFTIKHDSLKETCALSRDSWVFLGCTDSPELLCDYWKQLIGHLRSKLTPSLRYSQQHLIKNTEPEILAQTIGRYALSWTKEYLNKRKTLLRGVGSERSDLLKAAVL